MSDYSMLRKGDLVRVTLEGVVDSQALSASPFDKTRTLRLIVAEEKCDVVLSWDDAVASPDFTLLDVSYSPGDLAQYMDAANWPRRAMYSKRGHWITDSGATLMTDDITTRRGFTLLFRPPAL